MSPAVWLLKSEPAAFSWDIFLRQYAAKGPVLWDGVRNYQARNNLKAMRLGDLALFYHSVTGKAIVGLARVAAEHFPDPTSPDPRWVAVNLAPLGPLARALGLEEIKADPELREMALVRQSRLSVMPVTAAQLARILLLTGTAAPRSE